MDISNLLERFESHLARYDTTLAVSPHFTMQHDANLSSEAEIVRAPRDTLKFLPVNPQDAPEARRVGNPPNAHPLGPSGLSADSPILISSEEEGEITTPIRTRLPTRTRQSAQDSMPTMPPEDEENGAKRMPRRMRRAARRLVTAAKDFTVKTIQRKRKRGLLSSPSLRISTSLSPRGRSSPAPKIINGGDFHGSVVIRERDAAQRYAISMEAPQPTNRHVFFVDGSMYLRHEGAGVAWQIPPSSIWYSNSFILPFSTHSSTGSEIFAVGKALELAIHQIKLLSESAMPTKGQRHEVLVFTDSENALERIGEYNTSVYKLPPKKKAKVLLPIAMLMEPIIVASNTLFQMGASIQLHLVPGHKGVQGNELAHSAAWKASHAPTRPSPIGLPSVPSPGPHQETSSLEFLLAPSDPQTITRVRSI